MRLGDGIVIGKSSQCKSSKRVILCYTNAATRRTLQGVEGREVLRDASEQDGGSRHFMFLVLVRTLWRLAIWNISCYSGVSIGERALRSACFTDDSEPIGRHDPGVQSLSWLENHERHEQVLDVGGESRRSPNARRDGGERPTRSDAARSQCLLPCRRSQKLSSPI